MKSYGWYEYRNSFWGTAVNGTENTKYWPDFFNSGQWNFVLLNFATGDSSAEAAIQKAIDEVNGRIASGEGLVNNTNNTGGDATETKETAEHEDTNQSTNKDTNQGENKDTNQNANKDTNQNANKDTNQGANNSEKGEDEQKEQAKGGFYRGDSNIYMN